MTAFLFDQKRGEQIDAWAEAVENLGDDQIVWIDLLEPTEAEELEVAETLDLGDPAHARLGRDEVRAGMRQFERYIRLTAFAVSDDESDPDRERVPISCLVGSGWVVTVRENPVAVIEDFRTRAEGASELGRLDAPSFLAALLEWVVTSYLRAFDEIQAALEEFDVDVLQRGGSDTERHIGVLVDMRRRVGNLRRALAPHRELFAALSHSEFDPLSSDQSAERFTRLSESVEAALASARDAKDAVVGSFDVLIVRTEHRTNEIMKILTLASILLLPGALIAGVMGMNVNFKASVFADSPLFWAVIITIVLLSVATLAAARARRWI
ncbi:MAG: magnesium transporter CorA family protein [Gaiellaceae bacterium]